MTTEHTVLVGGTPVPCNEDEWTVATAGVGSWLKVTPHEPMGRTPESGGRKPESFVMVLTGSMWYDGVIANGYEPDPDDMIRRSAYPALGDNVEVVLAR